MSGLKAKTSRGSNFNNEEKEKIVGLCLKYKGVIENKKSDSMSISAKSKAWDKIAAEFNASCEKNTKTARQLKMFYKNQKAVIRKNLAAEKAETFKTGGGRFERSNIVNESLAMIVEEEMTPLENVFDSSCDYFSINENSQDEDSQDMRQEKTNENLEEEVATIAQSAQESLMGSVEVNNSQPPKIPERKNRRNNSYLRKYVEDFSDLKKKSLISQIEKNRAKAEKAKKEIELLDLKIASLRRDHSN